MNGTQEILCESANGQTVVFDPVHSHAATHFHDCPDLRVLVREALSAWELKGDLMARDIDMGRTIGNSDVVETDDTDEIVYAIRKNREDQGYVPFVKSRSAQPSRLLSVYLLKRDARTYELLTAWIGAYESPMFPQMGNAAADSVPYWSSHAFVWGSQEIMPGTERSDCPW